jgi:methylmalonyl-CoA mutase N-terminal domain/subunit
MRQYAGYASAKESNERDHFLLDHRSTGLSMAFDLPTQLGLDSGDPRRLGEVGRTRSRSTRSTTCGPRSTVLRSTRSRRRCDECLGRRGAAAALRARRRGAGRSAGLEINKFAPRLAFFFNGDNNVFQEVPSFEARAGCGPNHARTLRCQGRATRGGCASKLQTGRVTLTAQQPENHIVRAAIQCFAAVCGGTQSLHVNDFDEALALPTERAARIALGTQKILGHESGAADTVDPFAES